MKRFFAILAAVFMLASGMLCVSAEESAETSIDTESQLYKKCVLFAGDSICEASNEWGSATVGWAGRIMQWNAMRGFNVGKSGASISTVRGANTVISQLQRQQKNALEFDFVIMHGGVNDAWDSAPVGVMTEGFDERFDTTTFAGGLEATFKYAKETFVNAKYGYIINFRQPLATKYGRLSDMSEYVEVAKQICDKWGIDYLDLYNDENLNQNLLKTHTMKYLPDTIHPNTAGYDIISPIINDWMKTVTNETAEESLPESTEAVESSESDVESKGIDADILVYIVCGVVVVAAIAVVALVLKTK
ncbi:MAG: SGNH/GDSL hydrolase family protein [Clostridia bacterium]|nr:SGNH/GDSL hydrolase family protein [Clostridia bacterium]